MQTYSFLLGITSFYIRFDKLDGQIYHECINHTKDFVKAVIKYNYLYTLKHEFNNAICSQVLL